MDQPEYRCVLDGEPWTVRAHLPRLAALRVARLTFESGDMRDSYSVRVTRTRDLMSAAYVIERYEVDPRAPEPKHVSRPRRAVLKATQIVSRYQSRHGDLP